MRSEPIIPAANRTSPRTAVRRLALGRFISYTGTVASGTALSYSLYTETGSAAWVAAAMILTWGVIGLLGPISGAIGDRFDRRLVMIIGESAAAVCWLVMAFLTDLPVLVLASPSSPRCSKRPSRLRPARRSPMSPERRTCRGRTA
jgi:MFS transporter, DHA3 family, macrolide efflux protein